MRVLRAFIGSTTAREVGARFLELFFLSGFALAQPLFALLEQYPEFLADHGLGRRELLELAFALTCLLPATLTLLASVVSLVSRVGGAWLHSASLGVLLAALVLPAMALPATGGAAAAAALVGALAVGAVGAWAHHRFERVRTSLRFVSPLAVLFPVLFLASESIRPVWADVAGALRAPALESETPVLFVVFDELPLSSLMTEAGDIDPVRYPHFAALARQSYWFRNATTVSAWTRVAIESMMTGSRSNRNPLLAENRNLLALLRNGMGVVAMGGPASADYNPPAPERSRVLVDLGVLYAHRIVPAAWGGALPELSGRWSGFADDPLVQAEESEAFPASHEEDWEYLRGRYAHTTIVSGLRALHAGTRPTLLYLHLRQPHGPWMYYPSGQAYTPPTHAHGRVQGQWSERAWPSIQALQRHLLQVGYADKILGTLIAEAKEVGLYDEALIVVVADHGQGFWPGDFDRKLTAQNLADVLSVPLLIKRPYQRERVVSDRNVELVDILPTVAGELGVDVPWAIEGGALFDPSVPERPHKVAMRTHQDGRRLGPDLQFDTASLERGRARTVARIRSLFGSKPAQLFDVVPAREGKRPGRVLLGRAIESIALRPRDPPSVVELPIEDWLDDVSRDAPAIAAHVVGRIRQQAEPRESLDLAVVVNGVVEAVTRTHPGTPDWKGNDWLLFTALLREDVLLDGRNRVEIFEVDYGADPIALVPTSLQPYTGPAWRRFVHGTP